MHSWAVVQRQEVEAREGKRLRFGTILELSLQLRAWLHDQEPTEEQICAV